jgi:tRNA U38,U39,U40 pseudouridine synthase TruA
MHYALAVLVFCTQIDYATAFWTSTTRQTTVNRPLPLSRQAPESEFKNADSSLLERHNERSCKYCQQGFASRNALFRHVRSNAECSNQFIAENGDAGVQSIHANSPRRVVALLVGYDTIQGDSTISTSKLANTAVRNAFVSLLGHSCPDLSVTQATAVDHRRVALAQEPTCAAIGDVITLRYRSSQSVDIENLVSEINILMEQQREQHLNEYSTILVKVLAAEKLTGRDATMGAEQDATQRAYHYLVPFSWLPDGNALNDWFLNGEVRDATTDINLKGRRRFGAKEKAHRPHLAPPPVSLKEWKHILKSAESRTLPETNSTLEANENEQAQSGKVRFRRLRLKEPRCWHNFADPALQGDASPSNKPVWKSLDRARTTDFWVPGHLAMKNQNEKQDVNMIVEVRGDGFVTQQVRRIIGSAIAVSHGWLPADFMDIATRPDVIVETPLAPSGRMYVAGARYDFSELHRSDALFEGGVQAQQLWVTELRNRLLSTCEQYKCTVWLDNLKNVVAPRIREQLLQVAESEARREKSKKTNNGLPHAMTSDEISSELQHGQYQKTLFSLRRIVAEKKWPDTSVARSRVIRSVDNEDKTVNDTQRGSFTVLNANIVGTDSPRLSLANRLFPELSSAIFELEQELTKSQGYDRLPSSHCAVNRNAEFTPHVDSGRGLGQSLSMIVGLGTYTDGRLLVEGVSHDIGYKPLEFDGWKLRHWTEPFDGERFSLVWFTPDDTPSKN